MTSEPVTFAVTDRVPAPEPTTHAVIRDASLAMAWWRAVPVRRWAEQTLSGIELFLLEAAVSMGGLDGAELTAVTGLPGGLLPALARRLVRTGVLTAVDGGYAVHPERGREALAAGHLRAVEVGRIDLVYLLESDELVALDAGASRNPLSRLDNRQLDPAYQVPVEPGLAQTLRSEFFGRRIRDGRVAGLSDRVFDVETPRADVPLLGHGFCPVYRCDAIVRQDRDRRVVHLTVRGGTVRKRRGDDSSVRKVAMRLTGADGLSGGWARTGDLLDGPEARGAAWTAITAGSPTEPPAASRTGPLTWRFHLTGDAVASLARNGRDLSAPVVLQARTPVFRAHLFVELAAADPVAAARIGVDHAIAAAERADSDPSALHRALADLAPHLPPIAAGHLAPEAVLDRTWRLGRYRLAYALRQTEDFRYA
jgi:hypothetical protein